MSTEEPEGEPLQQPAKRYVGDSVYVDFDGFYIILTTENGYHDDPRNRIAMEPAVWEALKSWAARLDEFKADYFRRNT